MKAGTRNEGLRTAKPDCKIPRNPEGEARARALFDAIDKTPSGARVLQKEQPKRAKG